MPVISKIQMPSGTTYDIHDSRVDNMNSFEYVICTGASDTPYGVKWGDPQVTGTLVASADTLSKIYLVPQTNGTNNYYDEYITVKTGSAAPYTYNWEKFGSTELPDMNDYVKNKSGHSGDTAGDLAYKNSASGTVSVPKTFSSSTSVATSSSTSVTVTGTPSGTIGTGTGAANYTPAGTISASAAGSTTSINNPTKKTVVTDMSVAAPSSTAASGELGYCEVDANGVLVLKKLVETTGDSITTSSTTVKTGDASYSFSGTGVQLKFTGSSTTSTGSVNIPTTFTTTTSVASSEDKTVTVS